MMVLPCADFHPPFSFKRLRSAFPLLTLSASSPLRSRRVVVTISLKLGEGMSLSPYLDVSTVGSVIRFLKTRSQGFLCLTCFNGTFTVHIEGSPLGVRRFLLSLTNALFLIRNALLFS